MDIVDFEAEEPEVPEEAWDEASSSLPAIFLPVQPGTPSEADALGALVAHARAAGVRDPRLFGYAAVAVPARIDALHAAVGLVCALPGLLGGSMRLLALVSLGLLLYSSARRALGRQGWLLLHPRVGCGAVVLRRPRTVRRVVASVLDRARPDERRIPRYTFVTLALLWTALLMGQHVLPAVLLVLLAGVRAGSRTRGHAVDPLAPERTAAEALVRHAARLDAEDEPDTAVVIAGRGALDAAGIRAFLDWYGHLPARGARSDLACVLVGAPRAAAAALKRRGLLPRVVAPSELEPQA